MRSRSAFGSLALFGLLAAFGPSAFADPPQDACALLSSAQVSSAVGVAIGAGTYVTPTFKKTCTWQASSPTPGGANTITLNISSQIGFDAGKRAAIAGAGTAKVTPAGVGDDSYFLEIGTQAGLMVKKGAVFLKFEVYGGGLAKEEAIEKALAQQVLPKL